jgi:site-specific DNA-methyltransferase (adenine-specific)
MSKMKTFAKILEGDVLQKLGEIDNPVHLTFFDPPYNQNKNYNGFFDDNKLPRDYWRHIKDILRKMNELTVDGGSIYFMQREKNAEEVLKVLRQTGWTYQNLIIWKKRTSAVPSGKRYGKQYQILAFFTKGPKPIVFNKLRIDYPLLPSYKYERDNGIFVTDVWDDIRELTSGFFAGDEALRDQNGRRIHEQQSPVALLLRIILSSSNVGDTVLDPMAGTGPTLVAAKQLNRNSVGIEIDPKHVETIKKRLAKTRVSDNLFQYYEYYRYTENLEGIWGSKPKERKSSTQNKMDAFTETVNSSIKKAKVQTNQKC